MMLSVDVKSRRELWFAISNDSQAIEESVNKICTCLNKSTNDSGFYCFALSEMLANAMEHGNKMNVDKLVTVEVFRFDCHYKVIITDEGQGFDWKSRHNLKLDLTGDSDRGRGIIMSKMMCDGLHYNREGNQVTIIVAVPNIYDSNSK